MTCMSILIERRFVLSYRNINVSFFPLFIISLTMKVFIVLHELVLDSLQGSVYNNQLSYTTANYSIPQHNTSITKNTSALFGVSRRRWYNKKKHTSTHASTDWSVSFLLRFYCENHGQLWGSFLFVNIWLLLDVYIINISILFALILNYEKSGNSNTGQGVLDPMYICVNGIFLFFFYNGPLKIINI